MLHDILLSEPTERQLVQMLAGVIAGGSGELSITVEKSKVKWLSPAALIHNPVEMCYQPNQPAKPNNLEDLIGPRLWPTFVSKLQDLIGHGWGRLTICVEHHQVQALHYAPSVQAVDGFSLAVH